MRIGAIMGDRRPRRSRTVVSGRGNAVSLTQITTFRERTGNCEGAAQPALADHLHGLRTRRRGAEMSRFTRKKLSGSTLWP